MDYISRVKKYLQEKKDYALPIISSPLFRWMLGIKVVCSFLFASSFLVDLFSRFVNYYVISGFENPYDFFYESGETNAFPYPSIMLWLLTIPRLLASPFLSIDYNVVSGWHIFIYRLPVLAADIIIFLILSRWLKTKQDKVLLYYWCSPILFYINYIHGQLDVLPIMFLFIYLYLLFKEQFRWAFVVLGLAIATKTAMLVVLPFAVVYVVVKKLRIIKIVELALIPFAVFIIVNGAYLASPGFINIVLETKQQMKVFDFNYEVSEGFIIYFIPLAYLVLLMKSLTYKTFNRDIFLMFLGFSFGILTLFIPPMQGWYYWIIPLFIYFYVKQENAPRFTFLILNIAYFSYFLLTKNSDVPQIFQFISQNAARAPTIYEILVNAGFDAGRISNIAFTILQTALLMNIVWIYRRGIESNVQYKIKYQPYLIGLAGDSGSGKTTIANLIKDIFKEKNTAILQGDDMHKWERGHEMWNTVTHLNPSANQLHAELNNLLRLKNGDTVLRREYDHGSGKFTVPKKLESKRVIILEGLHSLFLNQTRNILDLKIFTNPHEHLHLHWKIVRDMKERGYDKATIIEQVKKREDDSNQYIQIQEAHADISISLKNSIPLQNIGDEDEPLDIYLEFKCLNDVNFEPLLNQLVAEKNTTVHHMLHDKHQIIRVEGMVSKETISTIADMCIPELREITINDPVWQANWNGLIQLLVCYYIFEKMKIMEYGK